MYVDVYDSIFLNAPGSISENSCILTFYARIFNSFMIKSFFFFNNILIDIINNNMYITNIVVILRYKLCDTIGLCFFFGEV